MDSLDGVPYIGDLWLKDDPGPNIAEHAFQCRSLFRKYKDMQEDREDSLALDELRVRFSSFEMDFDVYGPPKDSMDDRLRFSPAAVDITHRLLELICTMLQSLEPTGDQPPQTSSRKKQRTSYDNSRVTGGADEDACDSESDFDAHKRRMLKASETINKACTQLRRVGHKAEKDARANRDRWIDRHRANEEVNKAIDELRLYTKCYIEMRFPKAPETLRSALVEANEVRFRRCLYDQVLQGRHLGPSIQRTETTSAVVQLPETTGSAPSAPPKSATTSKMRTPSPAPATDVAAFYAKARTEVSRAKSVLVDSKLSFPPIPPTQQCPHCGIFIKFTTTERSLWWQEHITRDLEPFICIFPHCLEGGRHKHGTGPLAFERWQDWNDHMLYAHGDKEWWCLAPYCDDRSVVTQEIQYQEHLIKVHNRTEAEAPEISKLHSKPVARKVLECPFGDDFQPSGKVESNSFFPGPRSVFPSEALKSHVADHMTEIALLTLQHLHGDNNDENVENIHSDQPSHKGE